MFHKAIELINENKLDYHNMQHINTMVAHMMMYGLDKNFILHQALKNPVNHSALLSAIYWHDTVYKFNVKPGFNEESSNDAYRYFQSLTDGREVSNLASDCILATAEHFNPNWKTDNFIVEFMMDLDVITFSYPWAEFYTINETLIWEQIKNTNKEVKEILEGTYKFLDEVACNLQYRIIPDATARLNQARQNITKLKEILKLRIKDLDFA